MAAEFLRPMNQGLESIGSATLFTDYVENTYKSTMLPLMAKSTRERYTGIVKNYLKPAFGLKCLRDLTPLTLQQYFSSLTRSGLSYESRDKIRDVMSSILGSSVTYVQSSHNSSILRGTTMTSESRPTTVYIAEHADGLCRFHLSPPGGFTSASGEIKFEEQLRVSAQTLLATQMTLTIFPVESVWRRSCSAEFRIEGKVGRWFAGPILVPAHGSAEVMLRSTALCGPTETCSTHPD